MSKLIIAEHHIAAGTEPVNTAHIYCITVPVGQDPAGLSSPRPVSLTAAMQALAGGLRSHLSGGSLTGCWLHSVPHWLLDCEPQIHICSCWEWPSVPCPGVFSNTASRFIKVHKKAVERVYEQEKSVRLS